MPSRLLAGQLPNERHGPLDPAVDLVLFAHAVRPDQQPAFHGATRDVEFPDVRLCQGVRSLVRVEAHDQRFLPNAYAHVAVEQETDPAEHLLLSEALAAAEAVADALGKKLAVGHAAP